MRQLAEVQETIAIDLRENGFLLSPSSGYSFLGVPVKTSTWFFNTEFECCLNTVVSNPEFGDWLLVGIQPFKKYLIGTMVDLSNLPESLSEGLS